MYFRLYDCIKLKQTNLLTSLLALVSEIFPNMFWHLIKERLPFCSCGVKEGLSDKDRLYNELVGLLNENRCTSSAWIRMHHILFRYWDIKQTCFRAIYFACINVWANVSAVLPPQFCHLSKKLKALELHSKQERFV